MKICLQCRTTNRESAAYCDNCGASLASTESFRVPTSPLPPLIPPYPSPMPPSRPSFPDIPGVVIEQVLGSGGASTIYRAHLEGDVKQLVAVKVVKTDSLENLEQEVNILRGLKHRNIIRVFSLPGQDEEWIGQTKDSDGAVCRYIIIEYLPGGTLEKSLGHEQFSLQQTISIFEQIALALDYAHSKQIIHLDIKPSNILFSLGRRVVLSDFGIGRLPSEQTWVPSGIVGTPDYMAPEVWDNEHVDYRADIYSLGIVLAEVLLGRPLFGSVNRISFESYRIRKEMLRGIPEELKGVVLKATADDPQKRHQSAGDLVADLRRLRYRVEARQQIRKVLRRALRPANWVAISAILFADLVYVLWLLAQVVYPRVVGFASPFFDLVSAMPVSIAVILAGLTAAAVLIYRRGGLESFINDYQYRERYYPAPLPRPPMYDPAPAYPASPGRDSRVIGIHGDSRTVTDRLSAEPVVPPPSLSEEFELKPLASISVMAGKKKGIRYELIAPKITIGRDQDSDIVLTDSSVSIAHADIVQENDDFVLYDLNSSNGTFVNGVQVTKHVLEEQDFIVVGGTGLSFQRTSAYRGAQQFKDIWQQFVTAVDEQDKQRISESAASMIGHLSSALDMPEPEHMTQSNWCNAFLIDTGTAFADTLVPSRLPVVCSIHCNVVRDNVEQLRQIASDSMGTLISLLMLVLPTEEVTSASIDSLVQAGHSRGYDIIPIGMKGLQAIVLSQNPRRTLRRLILANVDLLTFSPFVGEGPTPDSMFFGRERELREITERSAKNSHVVTGGRRIGKSSLLSRLHRVRLPAAGFLTIYHDCSATPTYETFLGATIRDWQPEQPSDAPVTFEELFRSSVQGKPFVLLLDEADKLIPSERINGWHLFNTLRAMANSGWGQVVFSGERTLREALRDSTSPFFNFTNEILIGRLEFRAAEELITHPMKQLEIELLDEATTVRRIYDFTSGHPNIIQRLCRRLVMRLSEQRTHCITMEDLNAVINAPKFQEEDFLNTYWERATPLEQIISLLMAQKNKSYQLQTILDLLATQDLHPEPEVVKAALDRLVDLRSILTHSQAGYEFAVLAFPLVLANTTTTEDLLLVLKSQYLKNPKEVIE